MSIFEMKMPTKRLSSTQEMIDQIRRNLLKLLNNDNKEPHEGLNAALLAIAEWTKFYEGIQTKRLPSDIIIEFTNFNALIETLEQRCSIAKELLAQNTEEAEILEGFYQKQIYEFTYNSAERVNRHFLFSTPKMVTVGHRDSLGVKIDYDLYPVMDQFGIRCTAAIPCEIKDHIAEIQINFTGTVDFASNYADLERGGPGQKSLKIHEQELLKKVNTLVEQVKNKYPYTDIRLKISGHSLGGALAKGFTHSLQRAIAVQNQSPDEVIDIIKTKMGDKVHEAKKQLKSLKSTLKEDALKFKNFDALSQVSGITVYALGAPGISKTTDDHASLLTYAKSPSFLRVYNHYHSEDIIRQFGDREFLSGTHIQPQIKTHKTIQLECEVTDNDILGYDSGPFPGMTARVKAAHNLEIYSLLSNKREIKQHVTNTCETAASLEKVTFSEFRWLLYELAFAVLNALSKIEAIANKYYFLRSYKVQEISEPILNLSTSPSSRSKFNSELNDIQNKLSELKEATQNDDEFDSSSTSFITS